ncbi:putative F-box protein [Cocos nucifera]|uniref:Putative F-box protein n=1 Tax=Cocos nucifera TaxID=13894 RepID=A0A8K0IGX8_COCNU|nr:putative F-box protein [Cocos nucifera]KAG1355419.1 putative F-box protein [Cocos nucifera]
MEEMRRAAAESQGASKQEEIKRRPSLANDIIFLILLRLSTASIFRFRWVSRQFHSIISDSSFIYSLALRATSSLVIQPKEDALKDTIDLYLINSNNTSEAAWITVEKPVESDFSLLACCDGLLCFRASRYYICNPRTREWIAVPCSKSSTDPPGGVGIPPKIQPRYLCGFYLHPSTGGYRLLARVCGVGFEVHTLGTNSWRGIHASTHHPASCTVDHSLAVHGNLHWVGTEGIIVFSMDSEEFSRMAYPAECNAWYQNHIMIMAQCLGLCKVTPRTRLEIWILKDRARKHWIKQHTISMHGFMNYTIRRPITLSEEEILLLCRDYREHQDGLIFCNAKCNAHKKFDIEGLIDWRSCKTFGMPLTTDFDKGKRCLI